MSFRPKKISEWQLRLRAKKASTALTAGGIAVFDTSSSGQLIMAGTTTDLIAGILQKTVASSDATTDLVPILVPVVPQTEVIVTGASGTLTPGVTCDIASGGLTIDAAASNEDIFSITKSLSSTSCEGYFNNPAPTRA